MSTFQFKQFSIEQARAAMKVGTDAMLLGAMSDHQDPSGILDVGTGTGVLALMLAQRFPKAKVHAVEIEDSAFNEAKSNTEKSPFAERVNVYHVDFKDWVTPIKYDLIVSNPPYFVNSLKNDSQIKTTARHADSLGALDFLNKAVQLMKENGVIEVIIPYDLLDLWESEARSLGLFIHRRIEIKGKPNSEVNRVILSLGKEEVQLENTMFIVREEDNSYSSAYIKLTEEFHDRIPK